MWRGNARWWFAGGEVAGGAVTGALLVVVGSLLRPVLPEAVRWTLVGAALLTVAGHDLGWYLLPLPQNPRQVPPTVIFDGGRVGALQFGFEMGTGLRTYLTSGLPHVLALSLAFLGPWWAGLAAGAAFGAGRALMPLSRMRWRPPAGWDRAFTAWSTRIHLLLLLSTAAGLTALLRTSLP